MQPRILWITVAMMCAAPTPRANARAVKRSLFGPALAWRITQPKRWLASSLANCSELRKKPIRPNSAALAKPAVPEHPGLHWGMTAAQVRWVLARRRWPTLLGCFKKPARAYLKLRRRMSTAVRGGPTTPWQVSLHFQSSAPYGLQEIRMVNHRRPNSQADAVVKAALAIYGSTPRRLPNPRLILRVWVYKWLRGKTNIKLTHIQFRPKTANLHIQYSPK